MSEFPGCEEGEDIIAVVVAGLIIIGGIALYLGPPSSFHPLAIIFLILGSLLMIISFFYMIYQKLILINEKLNYIRREHEVIHEQLESIMKK